MNQMPRFHVKTAELQAQQWYCYSKMQWFFFLGGGGGGDTCLVQEFIFENDDNQNAPKWIVKSSNNADAVVSTD